MLFNQNISNEELGAKVKAAHQKHLEHISAMRPIWELEGQQFRELRENLKIPRKKLSQHIGISAQVIAKFEKGQSVRSRNMLKQSFQTSIELIQLKRNNFVSTIKNKKSQ